jgi:hypothetical protein
MKMLATIACLFTLIAAALLLPLLFPASALAQTTIYTGPSGEYLGSSHRSGNTTIFTRPHWSV